MEHFDLDAAVRAGVIRSDQADALRRFDETERNAPAATEERFRLLSGFADIMAAIGIGMVAWAGIVLAVLVPFLGFTLLAAYWLAARYFTEQRRMMLTSFVLFGAFALTAAMASLAVVATLLGKSPLQMTKDDVFTIWSVLIASSTAGACWVYWRRFQFPAAYAAFAVAVINILVSLLRRLFPGMPIMGVDVVAALMGPILFLWAMWWDISDVRRETIRSDVGFWLHICAGFAIVHSFMVLLLDTKDGSTGWWRMFSDPAAPTATDAFAVLAMFGVFAVVALIVDRRSLLTSGMFYAVPALAVLIGGGALMLAPALLVTGVSLILLSVKWLPWREKLLARLPHQISAQMPRPQVKAFGPRPVY